MKCSFDARWRWVQIVPVSSITTGGGRGVPGRQVVVAAQQEIGGVRPRRSGRHQYLDYRLGWAAAAPGREARRPGPDGVFPACPGPFVPKARPHPASVRPQAAIRQGPSALLDRRSKGMPWPQVLWRVHNPAILVAESAGGFEMPVEPLQAADPG